ncbi:MAG: TolC family protein [Planctomycetales bacterium]|nr:TolC family protein [Planctomycetales bacterium]
MLVSHADRIGANDLMLLSPGHHARWSTGPLRQSRVGWLLALLALTCMAQQAGAQTVREATLPPISTEGVSLEARAKELAAGSAVAPTKPPPADVDPLSADVSAGGTKAKDASHLPLEETGEELVATADNSPVLTLADVIASVYRSYPVIEQSRLERSRAEGQLTEAYGAYDTKLQGYSLSEPTGFYENFRTGLGVARQTWWGGYLSAGYRVGRGGFQPWYKERETNKGGELKLALGVPLLQGRAIDSQRVAVFQASLARRAAEPLIQLSLLNVSREAAELYWQWIAAGGVLAAQRELLTLAVQRGEQYEVGVKAGKFPEIDLIFNQQLIAERSVKVLESEQKFRASSFKLSLYLRNEVGQPMIPNDAWLPDFFPVMDDLPEGDFQTDLSDALSRRPEPTLLQYEQRQIQFDQQLARNQLLPQLDLLSEASQDMGTPASSLNDKGQFELMVGVQGEVPIQRRKARGKIQSTSAKITQIEQKLRLLRDKIGVELQTAHNALILSSQMVDQSALSLRASVDTLTRYRFAFERGKVDLIYINLLESKVNESEIKLIEAQRKWFSALADMQAALGLDPLDQAISLSNLPPATRLGIPTEPTPATAPLPNS